MSLEVQGCAVYFSFLPFFQTRQYIICHLAFQVELTYIFSAQTYFVDNRLK